MQFKMPIYLDATKVLLLICVLASPQGIRKATASNINPFRDAGLEDILALFGTRNTFNEFELACQVTINDLRLVHQLGQLRWSDFFSSLADARVIQRMYESTTFSYTRIDLTNQFKISGEINFLEAEKISMVPKETLRNPRALPGLLAVHVKEILKNWYLQGIFNLTRPDGYYEKLLDPGLTGMGCSVRATEVEGGAMKMFMAVAFHEIRRGGNARQRRNRHLAPKSGRFCRANCSAEQSCYSHVSRAQLTSRIGYPMSSVSNCNCIKAVDGATNPFCSDTCFVYCPLATNDEQKYCHGERWCRCSLPDNAATCN
ncbi:unnamed protein product [Clavelina lepadiformis]|uniref:Uncharacterized protein n=1 Tax=Clavelina lepadiformis TaxID=159417 RepID=A0ABP0GQG9_CLALP